MASLQERATSEVASIRAHRPFVDHLLHTQRHYGAVQGSMLAGGVTYFGFLSFFPILALAFFVVGYVASVFPDARDTLVTGITDLFPGMIGDGPGQISLKTFEDAATKVGVLGAAGLLYSGLGWLSALRTALLATFESPRYDRPGFVTGKLRDLLTLVTVGVALLLSVAAAGLVQGFSAQLLDLLGLGRELSWLLAVGAVVIGLLSSMLLFFALFVLTARPPTSLRDLWSGALLGAVGFEALKQASAYLISLTQRSPAFQAFGIALILLVWISYFSRLIIYAAAWADTGARVRRLRSAPAPAGEGLAHGRLRGLAEVDRPARGRPGATHATAASAARAYAAGVASALGLVVLLKRRKKAS